MALNTVSYRPFTVNEVPESLLVRVMKPLRAGGTAPLSLYNQTPPYTAKVSLQKPDGTVTTRSATIYNPANLPTDYPDDFTTSETGWVQVQWQAGDFDQPGTYLVQISVDNGVVILKSPDLWAMEVNDAPASAVVL
jgi:hypothetical protein